MTTHLTKIWWDLNKHKLVEQAIPEAEIYKREWKGEEHMTRDDITLMAREAGFVGFDGENKCLRKFAALAYAAGAAAEREACIDLVAFYGGPVDLEAAIRARGNT